MFLVLIETSGNQNYIFSTNKLKENIGASELTYLAGTKWVLDAVAEVNGEAKLSLWTQAGSNELRKKILNSKLNQPIENSENNKIEVIIATSGKALLLARNEDDAREVIRRVTHKALIDAPGLDICGVFEEFDWGKNQLGEVNRKVHKKFETIRSQRTSPSLRFLRLPVVDECSTSGLPASRSEKINQDGKVQFVLRSQVSHSKRSSSSSGFARIENLLRRENSSFQFARSVRFLDEEWSKEDNRKEMEVTPLEWLAVVHADGNGLGEIFLNFGQYVEDNRNYINSYREFSLALDECTEKAFLSSLDVFESEENGLVPIVPLILGGDDLTVICDGKSALQFTENFLINFEKETNKSQSFNKIIPKTAEKALEVDRLSACAGISIIKPHFPFSVAYHLAEDLIKSAKNVKNKVVNTKTGKPHPCSALDFHILYDSSDVELKIIREKLEIDNPKDKINEKILLHARPYIVTNINQLAESNGKDWASFHSWKKLHNKVKVLVDLDTENEGKRKLPNSQMYDLREGLFLGKEVADARYKLIRERYRNQGIVQLAGDEQSLFQQEPTTGIEMTQLLDAIDIADFLNIREKNNGQEKQEEQQ